MLCQVPSRRAPRARMQHGLVLQCCCLEYLRMRCAGVRLVHQWTEKMYVDGPPALVFAEAKDDFFSPGRKLPLAAL